MDFTIYPELPASTSPGSRVETKPPRPVTVVDDGVLVSPDGEKTAWFKDSEGNILAIGSST